MPGESCSVVCHHCGVVEIDGEEQGSIPVRSVRAQLAAGVNALDVLGEHVKRHLDYWPIPSYPGTWLALDVRSHLGVAVARLEVEDWRPFGLPNGQDVPRSRSIDLKWEAASAIGRASEITRRLRVYRNRLYWAFEADKSEIHLAEQEQIDLYLEHLQQLAGAALRAAAKMARRA